MANRLPSVISAIRYETLAYWTDAAYPVAFRLGTIPNYGHYTQEVVMTEYVYNFGPRKFMRRLIFEGGVLVSIETIGYGYRESRNPSETR